MEPVEEDDGTGEEVEPESPLPDALHLPGAKPGPRGRRQERQRG